MSAGCDGYRQWETSRRDLMKVATLGALGLLGPSAISQIAVSPNPQNRDLLVVVFLRGGMDGLNAVAPYRDDHYRRARPNLRMEAPGVGANRVLDLDGDFGLHPTLAPILPLYKDGEMAIVHAVGSADQSRSHFEAMMVMERGSEDANRGLSSGWLARYLNATQGDSPLRAVSFSAIMPDSLKGGSNATNLTNISEYQLHANPAFQAALVQQYAKGDDEMAQAGRQTLQLLETLKKLDYSEYVSAGDYPQTDLGQGLRQAAFLGKADLGVEVVAIDTYGWDTHVAQGLNFDNLMVPLGKSLGAFAADMKSRWNRTTVVVMTEFGRRVYENGGLGTDHGRGSCMFVMGGAVKGGKIYGRWPGLDPKEREGEDLKVTTDYRDVLAELLRKRMGLTDPSQVFQGFAGKGLGLV